MSTSGNILPITHISQALKENLAYIKGRKNGTITSYRTKFERFNKCLLNGFEDNTICTISALSGGGKSALSQLFRESILDLNQDKRCVQIPMNFELIARSLAARSAATSIGMSLKKMYSIEEELSDKELQYVIDHYSKLEKNEVYFIDRAGTPKQIVDSLIHYWERFCKNKGKSFLYEIDHVKLIKKAVGQSDLDAIDDLCVRLVDFKKMVATEGGSSFGLLLSQMNREIKKDSRVLNAEMHKPDPSCLFGSSSMEFASDYIVFLHTPAKLGISSYTTHNLPTWYQLGDKKYMMPYFEIVKNRSGEPDITIPLMNELYKFNFEEMDKDVFTNLCEQFRDTKEVPIIKNQKQLFNV